MKWFDFSKEGDEFIKKLITIIEQENIEIRGQKNRVDLKFTVDDKTYEFGFNEDSKMCLLIMDSKTGKEENEIRISRKYYHYVDKLFNERERIKKIRILPDLSETGRAAKKYNL